MSWWIGYAELYFTAKKCPEFDVEEYVALKSYSDFTFPQLTVESEQLEKLSKLKIQKTEK